MIVMHHVFDEINMHLLHDDQPSVFINEQSETPLFGEYPLKMLSRLKRTEQSPKYHPEGNVWNHTMLVLDEAAGVKSQSRDEKAFMWAALLHDIGKPDTTKSRKGRITAYDHDKLGAVLAGEFLQELTEDQGFINRVVNLTRWHMQILYVVNDLPFADVKTMKKQADIHEIALLGLCDRLGRVGANRSQEEKNIKLFIRKCEMP